MPSYYTIDETYQRPQNGPARHNLETALLDEPTGPDWVWKNAQVLVLCQYPGRQDELCDSNVLEALTRDRIHRAIQNLRDNHRLNDVQRARLCLMSNGFKRWIQRDVREQIAAAKKSRAKPRKLRKRKAA